MSKYRSTMTVTDDDERAIKQKQLLKKFRSKRESINQVIELAQ